MMTIVIIAAVALLITGSKRCDNDHKAWPWAELQDWWEDWKRGNRKD